MEVVVVVVRWVFIVLSVVADGISDLRVYYVSLSVVDGSG